MLWLQFYLRKDCHPEPKLTIVKIFALGMLLAPLAVGAQWLFAFLVAHFSPGFDISNSSTFYLWSAFSEEVVKFLAVYYLVMHSPEFDEPVDGMIYLVTAALGFAAIENILVGFRNIPDGIAITLQILALRTFGATLLHTIASALVGYFLALSWFHHRHSRKFLWCGIGCATVFHFAFNAILLNFSPLKGLIASSMVLFMMLALISILFAKLRERSASKLHGLSTQQDTMV